MRLPVHIWMREENAIPKEIAGYFVELARRLDECPRKMRLAIESTVPVVLDFDPSDGDPVVMVGGISKKFSVRHRWIPEHPVPLRLGPSGENRRWRFLPFRSCCRTVLLIDPVEGNRFKVQASREIRALDWFPVLFMASALVAVLTLHPVAIAVAAVLFLGCLLGKCR